MQNSKEANLLKEFTAQKEVRLSEMNLLEKNGTRAIRRHKVSKTSQK
jgi:hypothetical protein